MAGANRYRNPDEDLPADFEAQRIPYYQALNLPLDPDRFIADLQAEMRDALQTLDAVLPNNAHVRHNEGSREGQSISSGAAWRLLARCHSGKT